VTAATLAVVVVLGVYLVLVVIAFLLQRRLIFPAPGANPFFPPAWEGCRISIEHDGIAFSGWIISNTQARREGLLLYCGGNGEEVSWNCETFADFDVAHVALINYRGYGGTPGLPSERALVADTRALLDGLQHRTGVADEQTVLMGRSIGTGVAVQAAAGRRLAGLLLITPLASVQRLAARSFPLLPVRWILRHPFDNLAVARSTELRAEMIVAGNDEVIPPGEAALLAQAWAGPCESVTLSGSGHNTVHDHPGYLAAVDAALDRLLPSAGLAPAATAPDSSA
jgi:pimeloyl-ACP methyl ester carboxylesterase